MSGQGIPLSDVNAEFNEDTEPRDDKLIELLKLAYSHQLDCQNAIIPLDLIKPFSDYQRVIDEVFYRNFITDYEAGKPWHLLVYKEGDKYIMSDDYNSYYLYLRLKASVALCTVIDPTPDDRIKYLGQPFKLPPPTAEIIE